MSFADRVKETTTTTGTGTVTLAGAASGYQTFSTAFAADSVVSYAIISGVNWETGRGTFTNSGTTLSRDEVYSSSAAGAKITLAGTSDVLLTLTSVDTVGKQSLHGFNLTTSAPSAITNGYRRVSIDNAANVDLAYDTATRQITLTQTGGVVYWFKGQKVTVASPIVSAAHSATAGAYYIYFDSTTGLPTISASVWNMQTMIPIAEVYYDGTKGVAWDERHAAQRDPAMHFYLHSTQGAKWSAGGLISGYTLELGSNAGVQYALTAATVYDEDIRATTTALSAAGPYTVWYKSAGVWTYDTTPTVPYKSGTNIQYNNAGVLTDIQAGHFVNYYVYGTTNLISAHSIIHHVGQRAYNNMGEALEESLQTGLDLAGFPSAETVPMYRLTFWCDAKSTSTGKAVLVDVTNLGGDRNFNPATNPSNRSPDHMTMGRVYAMIQGLNLP